MERTCLQFSVPACQSMIFEPTSESTGSQGGSHARVKSSVESQERVRQESFGSEELESRGELIQC